MALYELITQKGIQSRLAVFEERFKRENNQVLAKEYHQIYGILMDLLDGLSDITGTASSETLLDKVASMSCKAAVKGNHQMSSMEAKALIDELLSLENPYNCPHGRPTIISMSKYELEKKFKRIV